jgi:hypothetical protein
MVNLAFTPGRVMVKISLILLSTDGNFTIMLLPFRKWRIE